MLVNSEYRYTNVFSLFIIYYLLSEKIGQVSLTLFTLAPQAAWVILCTNTRQNVDCITVLNDVNAALDTLENQPVTFLPIEKICGLKQTPAIATRKSTILHPRQQCSVCEVSETSRHL